MIVYWILIAIPALLSFSAMRQRKQLNWSCLLVGILYLLFIGLRYNVGSDRVNYANMFATIASLPFMQAITFTEPGYATVNWLVAAAGGEIYWVNFIVALLFISGLVRFAKLMPQPWVALLSVTPYLVIVIGMSAVRQSAAIGLVFHLMAGWRKGLLQKILLSMAAMAFHYSAVMALVFVQQSIRMRAWVRGGLLLLAAAVIFPILNATDAYAKYQNAYLEKNIVSSGALMHVLLNAIPATIYWLARSKWHGRFGQNDLLPMLSILSIASVFGVYVSSTGIDRLALYLSPIQMMVYGGLPFLFGRRYRLLTALMIVSYHLIVMGWWLNYANTATSFIPYNNLILFWLGE